LTDQRFGAGMQTANPDPPIHRHQFWPDTSCIGL
jgi:hypothetical protein